MNCCSGINPSVRSIFSLLANGSSPIIMGGGKLLPAVGMTGGAALNGIGSSPDAVMLPLLGGVEVILEGGGTGGAAEMCPGVPNNGVVIEGGFGGAIISADERACILGPILGSTDLWEEIATETKTHTIYLYKHTHISTAYLEISIPTTVFHGRHNPPT